MALIKLSNNGVKNITSVGSVGTGDLVFISKQTASSSASIEFTSGIDSTYKEYVFYFNSIHPQNDSVQFQFNLSTDSGSNYNVTKTSTYFRTYQSEADSGADLEYITDSDLAQSTGFQRLSKNIGNDNDQSLSGYLNFFNPNSNTFVKHFLATTSFSEAGNFLETSHVAGYGNTTSPINAIKFAMSSGNIDSGEILLYGVN